MWAFALIVFGGLLIPGTEASASKPFLSEGHASFGISLWSNFQTDTAGVWAVAIEAGDMESPSEAVGLARIEVEGAQVLSGDTKRKIHPAVGSGDSNWQLVLKRTGDGQATVRAFLRIPGANASSYIYVERLLRLDFNGQRVSPIENRAVVQVIVRDGQAFRYGGAYPVAVDPDDLETPDRIDSPAELIDGGLLQCRACHLSEPVDVRVVVTVGKDGTVRWIRPKPVSGEVDERVWAAVRAGLRQYRFRPALSHGHPVADYAILAVQVAPDTH